MYFLENLLGCDIIFQNSVQSHVCTKVLFVFFIVALIHSFFRCLEKNLSFARIFDSFIYEAGVNRVASSVGFPYGACTGCSEHRQKRALAVVSTDRSENMSRAIPSSVSLPTTIDSDCRHERVFRRRWSNLDRLSLAGKCRNGSGLPRRGRSTRDCARLESPCRECLGWWRRKPRSMGRWRQRAKGDAWSHRQIVWRKKHTTFIASEPEFC